MVPGTPETLNPRPLGGGVASGVGPGQGGPHTDCSSPQRPDAARRRPAAGEPLQVGPRSIDRSGRERQTPRMAPRRNSPGCEPERGRGWCRRSLVALLLPLFALRAAEGQAELRAPPRDSTVIVLLGTGMPYPDPEAQGPATAVVVGPRIFLFDAGPGVMRQMVAAGLPVRGGPVTATFLTHLHSDHTLGLPDLIFTSWVMGRTVPLRLIGPPGTRAMADHLLEAWREDILVRTRGLEHAAPGGYQVAVQETRGGVVYDSAGVRVTAIPVPHGSWTLAFAYRVDGPGKSAVISGDTRPSEALVGAARGVDVLIHEVYPASRVAPEPRPGGGDWPRYLRSFHTSDRELARLARRIRPGLLVLYHIVRMGATDEEILAAIRAGGYRGRTVVGRDLDRF